MRRAPFNPPATLCEIQIADCSRQSGWIVQVTGGSEPGHGVRGTFTDMAGARRAIDALQFGGIEANDIALSGEGVAQAEQLASRGNTGASDSPIIWRVVWRGFWWSIAGGVLGVAIGAVFGMSGLTLPGTSNSMALQIVSWAMFLHVGGAIVGIYAGVTTGSAWELTFQPVAGAVTVAVRSGDTGRIAKAKRILHEKQATGIQRT